MKLIVLGAGACGFLRLNNILQKFFNVTYKGGKVKYQNGFEIWDKETSLRWLSSNSRKEAQHYYNTIGECDISHIPIKYVDDLLTIDSTIKFLCLQGEKEEQVKSLATHWGYRSPVFTKRNSYRARYPLQQFPDYSNEKNHFIAAEKYYEEYYSLAKVLEKKYPLNFLIANTESLFSGSMNDSIKFLLKHLFGFSEQLLKEFCKYPLDKNEITPTTALHGGLGNNLFQMAEVLAFAKEYNLPQPKFGTHNIVVPIPIRYHPDRFLGGHQGSQDDFIKSFKNLNWLSTMPPANYDTKFVINDMFDFKEVHHMKEAILEAFEPTESLKNYIKKVYTKIAGGAKTISLHLRMCGLPADDHTVSVPFNFHVKALEQFSDDHIVLVFSDNNLLANDYIEKLSLITPKKFYIVQENQFNTLFLMATCDNHILHVSTLSFWGAYLDQQQKGKTIYHKNFLKYHTDRMIPYKEWIMFE